MLWRDAPASAAPGLAQLAWDAVLDADTGVRLSRLDAGEDTRERLREAFQWDSTRVRLAELARLVGAPDPLTERRVAVLAAPATGTRWPCSSHRCWASSTAPPRWSSPTRPAWTNSTQRVSRCAPDRPPRPGSPTGPTSPRTARTPCCWT
ncbi:hypothetical protein ACFQ3Z_37265 [Streptomyces nogalater]